MRYFSIVCCTDGCPGLGKVVDPWAVGHLCLTSLDRVADGPVCVLFNTDTAMEATFDNLEIVQCQWPPHHSQQVMMMHVYWLMMADFQDGDEVIVSDYDVLYQQNPFQMFDEFDGDLLYCTRDFEYHVPVSTGVWAFRWSAGLREWLKFMLSQMLYPTWPQYKAVCDMRDEWTPWSRFVWPDEPTRRRVSDNDFFWALHVGLTTGKFDTNIKIQDMGAKYDSIADSDDLTAGYDEAREKLLAKVGDPNVAAIEFHSKMKPVMTEAWEKMNASD